MSLLPTAGGWRRDGIAVGDGPLRETQDVMWLQVGDDYADMRLGDDKRWAFAGVTAVVGSRVTWTHLVETEGDAFEDTGEMVAIPGGFAERGSFADGQPYLELWREITGELTPARSAVAGTTRVVRLGAHALWVTPTGAVRLLLTDAGWVLDDVVGAQPEGVVSFLASGRNCPAQFVEAPQAA